VKFHRHQHCNWRLHSSLFTIYPKVTLAKTLWRKFLPSLIEQGFQTMYVFDVQILDYGSNLDHQVGHFMLDSAANNDTAMRHLSMLLASCSISFNADQCQIICLPHPLNTCAKHIMENYKSVDFLTVVPHAWIDNHGCAINRDSYVGELEQDPIKHGQTIACCICALHLCWQAFQGTIKTVNSCASFYKRYHLKTQSSSRFWEHWDLKACSSFPSLVTYSSP